MVLRKKSLSLWIWNHDNVKIIFHISLTEVWLVWMRSQVVVWDPEPWYITCPLLSLLLCWESSWCSSSTLETQNSRRISEKELRTMRFPVLMPFLTSSETCSLRTWSRLASSRYDTASHELPQETTLCSKLIQHTYCVNMAAENKALISVNVNICCLRC